MANVGQFLAVGFRFLYRNVVRGLCCVYWREPDLDLVETYACPANGMPKLVSRDFNHFNLTLLVNLDLVFNCYVRAVKFPVGQRAGPDV